MKIIKLTETNYVCSYDRIYVIKTYVSQFNALDLLFLTKDIQFYCSQFDMRNASYCDQRNIF